MPPKGRKRKVMEEAKVVEAVNDPSDEQAADVINADDGELFRFRFEGMSELDEEGMESPIKIIQGIPWKMSVFACPPEPKFHMRPHNLVVSLECVLQDSGPFWFVVVKTRTKLVHPFPAEEDKFERREQRKVSRIASNTSSTIWGYNGILNGNADLFSDGDSLTVEMYVKVLRMAMKDPPLREMDFSSPSTLSDGIIVVQKKKIHVNKQMLAHHSSFFNTLFFGEFREAKQDEVTIEDVIVEEMTELLNVVYGTKNLRAEKAADILKLADRFDMRLVMASMDTFLSREPIHDSFVYHTIQLADQYKLPFTMDACMERLRERAPIKRILESLEFDAFSAEVKEEITQKLLNVTGTD